MFISPLMISIAFEIMHFFSFVGSMLHIVWLICSAICLYPTMCVVFRSFSRFSAGEFIVWFSLICRVFQVIGSIFPNLIIFWSSL